MHGRQPCAHLWFIQHVLSIAVELKPITVDEILSAWATQAGFFQAFVKNAPFLMPVKQ
jgi:hypothetical protein